ncbi:amino acid ABC transporter permease [Pigmentiphaga soli]|uniref:Amino acid ABC transporter permease n=1 Tax=Pigmentiphaga soli TaxID=1007095 RepID=A0ABP8HJL8_9BURK
MNAFDLFLRQVAEAGPQLLTGLGHTVMLAAVVSVTGLVGGIVVFYLTLSPGRACRRLTEAYISFFIGTPLLALLFLMYYGLPQWGFRPSPLAVAVVGFTMNVAAYNARYLATAYRGLDRDELEAARAQGFSGLQVFRLITLPQVLRLSVPALSNQVILNLKDSSIAFLIQYTEFFAQVQDVAMRHFQFFKSYVMAGLAYLAMVSVIVLAARHLERRYILPGTRRP